MQDYSSCPSTDSDLRASAERKRLSARRGAKIFLVFAFLLSIFSFLSSRCDSWNEVYTLWWLNFLLIGPFWAISAFAFGMSLKTKSKIRAALVLGLFAYAVPASLLSLMQTAATQIRFATSERMITHSHMKQIFASIEGYIRNHREIPTDLSVLPLAKDCPSMIEDYWSQRFQYAVDQDGIISLTSLGPKEPSNNQSRKFVMRYKTRNNDGTLNIDDKNWLENAKMPED